MSDGRMAGCSAKSVVDSGATAALRPSPESSQSTRLTVAAALAGTSRSVLNGGCSEAGGGAEAEAEAGAEAGVVVGVEAGAEAESGAEAGARRIVGSGTDRVMAAGGAALAVEGLAGLRAAAGLAGAGSGCCPLRLPSAL